MIYWARMKLASLWFMAFILVSCSEGDTREIYEFVLSEDLGIINIVLEKNHDDFLREGREVQVRAIATLESGATLDISKDVRWSSSDSSVLKSVGGGIFRAQAVPSTSTVQAMADFAGFHLSADITVSAAALSSLEIGPAQVGIQGRCQIDLSITTQDQCSALPLCALGSYVGELEMRDETLFVDFVGTQQSVFVGGYLINAEINLESGAILESIYASLDAIDSSSIYITHEQNLASFSPESSIDVVEMGESVTFSVPSLPAEVHEFVDWSYVDFNLGEPSASGVITGGVFKADFESEFVSNFNNYGVDVFASCSGKSSLAKSLLIASDVDSLKITDDGSGVEVLIGNGEGPTLTLKAYDKNDQDIGLEAGDVGWFVCDLSSPQCELVDKQLSDSLSLDLIPDNNEIARDLRVEAIYHGRKAVREDFSFVTN